jgi:hypothetical protein
MEKRIGTTRTGKDGCLMQGTKAVFSAYPGNNDMDTLKFGHNSLVFIAF